MTPHVCKITFFVLDESSKDQGEENTEDSQEPKAEL